jgi:thiamine pyrophosphate-dependent acetolactate synthase large subunit-like protein/acetyl esterase/lipase
MKVSSEQAPAAGPAAPGAAAYVAAIATAGRESAQDPVVRWCYGPEAGQQLDVYVPREPMTAALPVVIFFHGGAWIRGGLDWLRFMAPAVKSLPAIFVAGTYRLAPGNKWPAQYDDVREAIAFIAQRVHEVGGDAARMVVGGHSAGGHLAALAVLKREIPGVLGCLPVSSPCDLRYGDVPADSDEGRVYKFLLAHRDEDADASPVLFTEGNRVPFHMTWGANDFTRIVNSGHAFVSALQHHGTRTTQRVVRGAGHFDTHLQLADPQDPWYTQVRSMLGLRTRMTLGQRIVELLGHEGVTTVYSQGDITTRDVLMHAQRQGMNTVGPRHEASTVFAAMGDYMVSGQVQAAFGAMGPGVANLLPAAVAAAKEQIPVIIFGARRRHGVADAVRRGNWLFSPMAPLFAEICKYSAVVRHPAELDEIVQQAFRLALSGTPGPCYVEYDSMMQIEAWEYPPMVSPQRYRAAPQGASAAVIERAVALVREAKSPILMGGEAVQHAGAREAFVALAEQLGCPVLTTVAGSGLISAAHPQLLLFQTQAAEEAIADSDLLLTIGTCLPENANYGRLAQFARNEKMRTVVSLDTDAAAIGINRPVDLAVIGDLKTCIAQLATALGAARSMNPKMGEWRAMLDREHLDHIASIPVTDGIHPSHLMLAARNAVPDDTTIVIDGGLTLFYQMAFFEKRGAPFVYGAHYSHLGCGLPQAIGAQIAQGREKPVCLITGDGALGFHFMEFETAVRHALPIVIVINDDHALGAEMAAHMAHIGHAIEVVFTPIRYDLMAQAMGGHGEHVERLEDVQPAIQRAFASGKPAVVQVVTDPDANHKFPHPFAAARASWIHADVVDKYGA